MKAHKTLYDPDFYVICSHPSWHPPTVNVTPDVLDVSLHLGYRKLTSPLGILC